MITRRITIVTTIGKIDIVGFYRRDLEKPNWHYYEDSEGNIYHFRKEHLVYVIEKDIK